MPGEGEHGELLDRLNREAEETGVLDMLEMSERSYDLTEVHLSSEDDSEPVETIVSNNTR